MFFGGGFGGGEQLTGHKGADLRLIYLLVSKRPLLERKRI